MARRHLVTLLFLYPSVASAAAAAVVLHDVRVRVYSTTPRLETAARTAALDIARLTLRPAVTIDWLDCAGRDRPAACEASPGPGELVLRILEAGDRSVGASAGATALRSPNLPLPLGDAYVDVGSRSGVLATIYLDRVAQLAGESGGSATTLLGRAIAHELGHLLLGTTAHSRHGLMRSLWSRDDIRRGRAADWSLTEVEASAIRARLRMTRAVAR
jgi:hypothetical protein